MKILKIILLSNSILFQCSPAFETKLASDSTITKIFSTTEIENLSKILDFFEGQICSIEKVEIANTLGCYSSFFERMQKGAEDGEIPIDISFDQQKILYQNIDRSTFDEIWGFNKMWRHISSDPLKSMGFNYDGKYVDFLGEYGKLNPIIYEYYDTYQQAGDISPSMVAGLVKNHQAYDISQVNIRLIIAIHYLTINDQYLRNEKY